MPLISSFVVCELYLLVLFTHTRHVCKVGCCDYEETPLQINRIKKQTVITIISKLNFMKENLCLTRVQNSKIVCVILNESETEIEQGLCIPFDCGCLRTDHKLNPY